MGCMGPLEFVVPSKFFGDVPVSSTGKSSGYQGIQYRAWNHEMTVTLIEFLFVTFIDTGHGVVPAWY